MPIHRYLRPFYFLHPPHSESPYRSPVADVYFRQGTHANDNKTVRSWPLIGDRRTWRMIYEGLVESDMAVVDESRAQVGVRAEPPTSQHIGRWKARWFRLSGRKARASADRFTLFAHHLSVQSPFAFQRLSLLSFLSFSLFISRTMIQFFCLSCMNNRDGYK